MRANNNDSVSRYRVAVLYPEAKNADRILR
jgi:hypothetical protein